MTQRSKFVLGGGGFCLYAPLFPRYQRLPGFADEVTLFNADFKPLFVLSLLEKGMPLMLACTGVTLRQGQAVLTYSSDNGVKMTETRFVTTDDRFVSQVEISADGKIERDLEIVAWTHTDPEGEPASLEGDSFRLKRVLSVKDYPVVPVEIVWSSPDSKGARCLEAYFAEGGSDRPDYEETPWFDTGELTTPRAKHVVEKPSPISAASRCYLGLFRRLKVKPGSPVAHRFEAFVMLRGKGLNYRGRRTDPKDENGYRAFMEKVPTFHSEDKRLERLFQHRLQLLHLLRMPGGVGHVSAPCVAEGLGSFHQPVAFSTPAILREARWLHDPSLVRGTLKVFFEQIRQNGMVPGRLFLTGLHATDFYHADWGGGFEALDAIHQDRTTKRAVLMAMQRYVKWLAINRDPDGSGLTDIVNHFESGQEFSRRYTIIDDKADRVQGFDEQFRLKGIDASVFRYRLVRYLAQVADELQEKAMVNRFVAEKEAIHEVIQRRMWDDKAGMFMDVDPKNRRRTGVKAAVGFYPLATDIPTAAQIEKMLDVLANKEEFWTKYPVPSLALSDPGFSARGMWKGTRIGCPWNGRVWPMINSHILEGLAYVAERGNKRAVKLCGDLFDRTVTMLSGELEGHEEPRSFEHYDPQSGLPGRFRGVDHYLHSFVLDNILRIGCGFVVRFGEIQDDPVSTNLVDFKLSDVPIGNKRFLIERRNGKLKVASQ